MCAGEGATGADGAKRRKAGYANGSAQWLDIGRCCPLECFTQPRHLSRIRSRHDVQATLSTGRCVGCLIGIDAPICQDKRLGCLRDVSAHAEVCHNTLVDFTSEEAFEAADDLASCPAGTVKLTLNGQALPLMGR